MAKKKTEPKTVHRPADPNVMGLRGTVVEQPITRTLDENYMPYAMSVIVSRAIPEIDGFKPSHRKLLYTMYKMGLLTGGRTKSANIVGQTMRLNPHGDQAIYETMVRLAKGNESLLHPFVDSKGNFGKVYSRDMAYAASRYTEAKLASICAELFRDIDQDTVDFVDNYDGSMQEPSLLPTTFPNVLVSANQGIAVGMASQICGFNLGEVCDTTVALLKNPDHDIASTLLAPDFPTGGQIICDPAELRELYHVDESLSEREARLIVGVRYELHSRDSYTFAEDVSTEVLSLITDGRYEGVTIRTASARVYNTALAAHILGTIGPIWQEEWSSNEDTGYVGYADKGYSMNDLVGKDGVEKAFESYLRGTDGRRLITTDETGKITGELYTREPQPGGTVALTLDIDLQADVEAALAETISGMIDKDSNERGGAAAVVSVGTGEVLALASYPTYDLSTFNEDYDELVNDQRLPMFNRATQGIYAPGSTFKMVTAVAALESGIITPSSIIQDRGIYTYYKDPQPMCWIYSQTGSTHGRINVSQAITDSCNYFFYEVGRLTGIRTLDSYASQFGLGQSTGIEIGDSSGVLASPEWAESHDQEWTDGQTITAAIGQSYNLFTPLQLANYVATLVGGGDHYQAHLLKNVKAYDNSRLLYMYDDNPINTVEMSDTTLSAVTRGMHELTVSGSVAYAFENCVVSAGAKTGSAQVGTDIANGVFVAYAPYEKPEIAVAIVIEKGGSGAALANTAVEIINSWFSRAQDGTAIGENTLLK